MTQLTKAIPRSALGVFFLLLLLLVPAFGGEFMIYLVSVALVFGIFAIAYDLLYGYTGLVSFGHCVFYGIPAYAVGAFTCTVYDINNPLVLFFIAIATGIILGLFVGFFCTFTHGIYLALVTFAFAQIFWLLVLSDPGGITYGENGIMAVRPPPLQLGGFSLCLFSGMGLYYLVLALLVASYLVIRLLVNSQLGDILRGIKQNERRLLSLGYNTRPYKMLAFALASISAFIS